MLPFDRVTDFSVLRRTTPYRDNFGIHRGKCIDRYYIEDFLATHAQDIRGRVLEIGSNEYTQKFGGDRVERSEVLDLDERNTRRTITADLAKCPVIPDDQFDCVICTQTLQFIFDVREAFAELCRIL